MEIKKTKKKTRYIGSIRNLTLFQTDKKRLRLTTIEASTTYEVEYRFFTYMLGCTSLKLLKFTISYMIASKKISSLR